MKVCDGPDCGELYDQDDCELAPDWTRVTIHRNDTIKDIDLCPACSDALADMLDEIADDSQKVKQ